MNTKSLVFAVAAACIGLATPAFAQDYDRDRGHRYEQRSEQRHERRDERAHDRYDRREHRADVREYRREVRHEVRHDMRRDDRNDGRNYARHDGRHYGQHRGAGPRYDLYRGSHLPSAYHGDRYVVRDYHRYNLGAPSRGHHWVRAGNDYVLVALATGLIAQVLLN